MWFLVNKSVAVKNEENIKLGQNLLEMNEFGVNKANLLQNLLNNLQKPQMIVYPVWVM